MRLNVYATRLGHMAASTLACVALAGRLCADEAPQDNPNAAANGIAIGTDLGFAVNTRLALDALYVATNTDWIGAEVAQVDEVLRAHLGLAEGKGLVVTSVVDGGPAAKAGVQKYDVLITVGGEEIAGVEALRKSLEASADKPIELGLIRGGKKQSIQVVPQSPANAGWADLDVLAVEAKYWLGVGLAAADEPLRAQLGVTEGQGLVVTKVESGSPAAKAGVMINDVLLKLDGKTLTTIEALNEQLQTIAEKSAQLELLRRNKPAMLTVTPEQHAQADSNGLRWLISNGVGHFSVTDQLTPSSTSDLAFIWRGDSLDVLSEPSAALILQLTNLEAQVKQLQTSLADLRAALESTAVPPQAVEEKK